MTKTQIEMWAVQLIDRAVAKHRVEDSRVELKSQWPEACDAARRIAGHANAARGEPILWLIGVDEGSGTATGADPLELSNWFEAVKTQFDGVVPALVDLNIPYNGRTIVGLYFETDRAPFVVRNAAYGKTGGGKVTLEMPWRESRSTRSATRLDCCAC
jgi:hypothetical protein